MGNSESSSVSYSIPVPKSKIRDNETEIYRSAIYPDELVKNFQDELIRNQWELFKKGLKINNGSRRCLGWRERGKSGELAQGYSWITFKETHDLALKFGSNLLEVVEDCLDLIEYKDEPYESARKMKLFGIFSKNCVEWLICDLAASAYGWVLVPLYDSLNAEGLDIIFEQTKLKICACSLDCLKVLVNAKKKYTYLKKLIVFLSPHETVSEKLVMQAKNLGLQCLTYADVLNRETDAVIEPITPELHHLSTLCYTSGASGIPKGVILTNENVVACAAGIYRGPKQTFFSINKDETTISYLPLAHVLERLVSCVVLSLGASIGFYSGDTTTLLEDVQLLNPTLFVSVPRLYNRINDAVFQNVEKKSAISRYLFARAKAVKLGKLRASASTTNRIWDNLVFNKTRKALGNSLRYMISGGAPLDSLVQEHMKILFCVPLLEGYGLTECFGPIFLCSSECTISGHVGGILPCGEFKIRSVPELDYSVEDNHPRGELFLRGPSITTGYFQNPEETSQSIDEDGWFHTGDIVVLLPGGAIKIIDRKKNIFKLAQGEYVAPEKLETIYLQCSLISQIFVSGDSTKTFVVAVVVPDEAAVQNWARLNVPDNKKKVDFNQLPELKQAILKQMENVGKTADLKGFERVKDIFIETEPFSIENDLLTPTLKIKRSIARQKYQKQVDEMYSSAKLVF